MNKIHFTNIFLTILFVYCSTVIISAKEEKSKGEIENSEPTIIDPVSQFERLPPNEQLEKLTTAFEEMDVDKDENVNLKEVKDWIDSCIRRNLMNAVDHMWSFHTKNNTGKLSWEQYSSRMYSQIEGDKKIEQTEENLYLLQDRRKNRRRWTAADMNDDGMLTKEEFIDFANPENTEDMKHLLGIERIEEFDKDNDGMLSFKEYFDSFMYQSESEEDEDEDELKKEEEENFRKFDLDKDELLDLDEVQSWVESEYRFDSEETTKNIFSSADGNNDSYLSKQEVFNAYYHLAGFLPLNLVQQLKSPAKEAE